MKRNAKALIAAMIFAAMTASAASCAAGQTYPLTIDGEQIRAGIYIFEQQAAINAAKDKINEEQPDLAANTEGFSYLNQTVEGKNFKDWVNETAVNYCRDYIAEKRLFASNGLSLTDEQKQHIKEDVNSLWSQDNYYAQLLYGTNTIGEYFESLGISKNSFSDLQEASEMRQTLFDHLYGEGGSLAATADEINAALESDYMAIAYFSYDLEKGDGAQAYYDRITKGESFAEVYAALTNAQLKETYDKQVEEAAQAAAEGVEEETESGVSTTPTEPATIDVPDENTLIRIVKKASTDPSEDFIKQAAEMAAGDVKLITTGEGDSAKSYIVKRYAILEYPDLTTSAVSALRSDLKQDEFENMLDSTGSTYSLTEDGSKNLYQIETILNYKKK